MGHFHSFSFTMIKLPFQQIEMQWKMCHSIASFQAPQWKIVSIIFDWWHDRMEIDKTTRQKRKQCTQSIGFWKCAQMNNKKSNSRAEKTHLPANELPLSLSLLCVSNWKWNEKKKKQRATQRKSHFLCDFIAQLLDKRHFFQLIVYERHTRIIPRCPPKYVSIVRTLSRCRCLLLRSFYGRKLKLIKILAQFFSPFPSRPVLHFDAYSMHIRTTPVQSQLVWRELWYEEKKKEKRRRETKE